MGKPKLLVLSHVLPYPRTSGQQQRVFYTLKETQKLFHVTFATPVKNGEGLEIEKNLADVCDQVVLLPSLYARSRTAKMWHRALATFYTLRRGLKVSNYIIGELEFSASRVAALLSSHKFDCVLFEYWHAAGSVPVFRERGIPCLLDMHDILWQDYRVELNSRQGVPGWWKRRSINQYKSQEESAWKQFDGVIAINREEMRYVQERIPETTKLFYAAMGIDLTLWPYSWNPTQPPRLAYYGGLASARNQQAALQCVNQIMPEIWHHFPNAELWLVGSNPPNSLRALSQDSRVKVTGYVEEVQKILATMSAVICPWSGTFGYRSRLVEVMALGVPVVASPDAVYGMELEDGKGMLLGGDEKELAAQTIRLLSDDVYAERQSSLARQQVERYCSVESTYGRLVEEVFAWVQSNAGK
jgi:glycosyltransferase involved in cell wall biosynthesis